MMCYKNQLINMYKNYYQLEHKKYFATWATRIIINKCYEFMRKNKNQATTYLSETFENTIQNSEEDTYNLDQYGIQNAIDALKEELKVVATLYYYEEFSVKEISKILDIPEGTVKSRLSKVRKILKQKLGKEEI